jgi:hypothetical protein
VQEHFDFSSVAVLPLWKRRIVNLTHRLWLPLLPVPSASRVGMPQDPPIVVSLHGKNRRIKPG